ncbi:MAG: M15 family metallopeptidase [Solobacterium sp.]|nr:M15 family metallopeptidase [Solobacterium sp.]
MDNLLPETSRKKWTAVFVAFIVLFTAVCLGYMNLNYDSLARYPFRDENSRELIKKYLNDEEIAYIIEYSIPPNMFVAYIDSPGFNIYHAAEYKKLSEQQWQKTPAMIVRMVEETLPYMDVDTLMTYLIDGNYSFDDVDAYISSGDYMQNSELVMFAGETDVFLDAAHTVSTRRPVLKTVDPEKIASKDGKRIQLTETAANSLYNLCTDISRGLESSRACAGLVISDGYISFDDQAERYEDAVVSFGDNARFYEPMPGHSEHQLGLAVDFGISGIMDESFEKTRQAQWLESNAWKYGYLQTWNVSDEPVTGIKGQNWHYRYVGLTLAETIHGMGITFAEYITRYN